MYSSQQTNEIAFWRELHATHGDAYRAYRIAEYDDKTRHFPAFVDDQRHLGLEVGCGLVSVLEDSPANVVCIDPLLTEYDRIVPIRTLSLLYLCVDGERLSEVFAPESFSWVMCVNVIDHTPHPERMLDEIHRVLIPNGRLFFEVHFDDHLGGPHYSLWNRATVDEHLNKFELQHEFTERVQEHHQWRMWGQYVKR